MATQVTSLVFEATNQNLWAPGTAADFRISTEDLLVYDPDELTYDFDFDILVAGAKGQAYLDFKIGLEAYAELGSGGHFDASYNIDVNVNFQSAFDVTLPGQSEVVFDVSDYAVRQATLSSEGFKQGRGAGLDVVIEATAGLRDIEYYAFGLVEGEVENINLFTLEGPIPLINISPTTELSVDLIQGVELIGRLPTGADTSGTSFGSAYVSSSGFSDTKFIELAADLDELLIYLASKIPGIGAVVKGVGEFVFAEHVFDVNEYVPFIPEGKIQLAAVMVDIDASAGAVLTEDLSLRIDSDDADFRPDIDVVFRSDNGTPLDFTDDKVVTGVLGDDDLSLALPTVPEVTALGGIGSVGVQGFYDVASATFKHSVGIGIDASITIEALKASIQGAWIPPGLSASFGPLLSLEFPEGGFQAKLFDFYTDEFDLETGEFTSVSAGTNPNSWGYQSGVFNQVTDTYEIFVTNQSPDGWDPDATNAVHSLYAYHAALQENQDAAAAVFGDLWPSPSGNDTIRTVFDGVNTPAQYGTDNHLTLLWNGKPAADGFSTGADSTVDLPSDPAKSNFVLVNLDPDEGGAPGRLGALLGHAGTTPFGSPATGLYQSGLGANEFIAADLLNHAATASYIRYQRLGGGHTEGAPTDVYESFSSTVPVNVKGGIEGDLIIHTGTDTVNRLYDGGDEFEPVKANNFFGRVDTFVADFGASRPGVAIEFDASEANFAGDGVTIAGNITIKNFESFVLRTGSADDFLTSGPFEDWFEAGGGQDYIELFFDVFTDYAFGQAGDDVIVHHYDILPNNLDRSNSLHDNYFGGTGVDLGVYEADDTYIPGVATGDNLLFTEVSVLVNQDKTLDVVSGSTPFDPVSSLVFQLELHDGGTFGDTTSYGTGLAENRDAMAQADADRDAVQYLARGPLATSYYSNGRFYSDIEGVSFLGSDYADDIALFNGGLEYFGGDGTYGEDVVTGGSSINQMDTLIADFGAYETRMGVTTGVVLFAEDRIGHTGPEILNSFGYSVIEGFERLVAKGTSEDDFFLGGKSPTGFSAAMATMSLMAVSLNRSQAWPSPSSPRQAATPRFPQQLIQPQPSRTFWSAARAMTPLCGPMTAMTALMAMTVARRFLIPIMTG